MIKLNFLSSLSKDEKDIADSLIKSIDFNSNINIVTQFLTAFEQDILKKVVEYNYSDYNLHFFGGIEDSERKKAKLIVNDYYDIDYDVVCLCAKYNNKFNTLTHRDVMGAFYNLGIKYNRVGDIILQDNNIYIFVDITVADYIIMNFTRIGRVNLSFEIKENINLSIEKKYEEFVVVSSSYRVDSVVSKIINKSRSKVKELLSQEFVKHNHVIMTDGDKNCEEGDVISIRKYGRYIVGKSSQNTKSKKYRIEIKKMV